MSLAEAAAELRDRLSRARRPLALTGAGISAESGIPTFRGVGGLWRGFKPEELATPRAFERDPVTVWQWYGWRRGLVARAEPNAGHRALAALERSFPEFWVITQNVDGLHRRAGSLHLLELHGNLWTLRCTACGRCGTDERVPLPLPPSCGACGGLLRPGVVWFGESLPADVFRRAWTLAQRADLLLAIGTSAVVEPAASLVRVAAEAGVTVIEINPEPSALAALAARAFPFRAAELLGALL